MICNLELKMLRGTRVDVEPKGVKFCFLLSLKSDNKIGLGRKRRQGAGDQVKDKTEILINTKRYCLKKREAVS